MKEIYIAAALTLIGILALQGYWILIVWIASKFL